MLPLRKSCLRVRKGGMDIKWNQWYHRLCAQTVNIDREINSNRVLNEISTFAFYSMQVKQHSLFNWYSTIIKLLNFQPVWQVVYKTMHWSIMSCTSRDKLISSFTFEMTQNIFTLTQKKINRITMTIDSGNGANWKKSPSFVVESSFKSLFLDEETDEGGTRGGAILEYSGSPQSKDITLPDTWHCSQDERKEMADIV